ncbi:hypothetical protein [Agromyces sp. NBRC 114283]|uniref:VG15 protein n=1 Tax=Agromyces sp. NBRC 114283 TaxID=2994521 RepID=UPI0024A5B89E|nr:hypothetical protein [Agromyces sp. NBRC 114283]GLU88945.1 hypothetical protein Agsp01_12000 [Agromyces sp. NBRC 114283]
MVTANESRAAFEAVTDAAVETAAVFLASTSGSAAARRAALLDGVPELISYFSDGTAALAVDFYEEERERAGVEAPFAALLANEDRTVKVRRGIAWAADPLFSDDNAAAGARLAEVVQLETARAYRETILANRRHDPASVGWTRIPNPGACRFCRFLAAKGAIYKRDTARFAAHPTCKCSAAPVFKGGEQGPEASVEQYMASRRRRTPQQQAALRNWLDYFEETGSLRLPA